MSLIELLRALDIELLKRQQLDVNQSRIEQTSLSQ